MRALYEINKDLERVLDENAVVKLDDGTAVDTDTGELFNLEEKIDGLLMERDKKIEGVALYTDDLLVKRAALAERIKALQEMAKSLDKQTDRLMDYLVHAIDGKEFSTNNVVIKVRKSQETEITDPSEIPDEYKHEEIKREIKIDKAAIKAAIKAGADVPGAQVKTNYNLTII